MATKSKFQAIRGTRDLLPPETALWTRVEQTAHEVFRTFGFGEIRQPIFEETELFSRSIGLETDIVGKEMFTFNEGQMLDLPENFALWEETVAAAWQRGEIPRTAHNEKQVSQFGEAYRQIRQLFAADAKLTEENVGPFIRHFQRMHRTIEKIAVQVTLRPEATASVCRAYIEHGMAQLPQPVKLYYMGPMFRRERPQKGRYRQFYQIGAEVLGGTDAPAIDAEVIEMVMTFFDRLGLKGVQLDINSIGDRNCRPQYVELLRAELLKVKDKLGADSQRRIETNPLRVLDSKLESEQSIIATLPHIADHLCKDCAEHYAAVKRELGLRGVTYKENWRLVRGLDYYMRTTFEITAAGLGSQNAVCGGGRYDGLVELLGGPPTKGIGFAIGEDRLILSLLDAKNQSPVTSHQSLSVYIAWMGEHAQAAAIRAAKAIRSAGFSVELPPVEQKFGKALERASKLNSRYALILGDNEVAQGSWTLKTLADGSQQKFTEPQLLDFLNRSRDA